MARRSQPPRHRAGRFLTMVSLAMPRSSRAWCLMAVVVVAMLSAILAPCFPTCFAPNAALAAEIRLKNGMAVQGKSVPIEALTRALAKQSAGEIAVKSVTMIDSGRQRCFVPTRQIEGSDDVLDIARLERFKLPQKSVGRKDLTVSSLGAFEATEFDEFGRRRVTINTARGPLPIVQGITEISPNHVLITGLTHKWDHALATSSIPPKTLDMLIRKATKPNNPDDRLAIARFYLQAQNYARSREELDSIVRDFPELKATAEEVNTQVQQLQGRFLLNELRRRKKAGQHRLAYESAKIFPTENMTADVLREVRELIQETDTAIERGKKAVALLGDLQAALTDESRRVAVGPVRTAIVESLDIDTLDRLDAFLKLEADANLKPDEKLALAVSGWTLGGQNAVTEFDQAMRLWNARHLVLDYLATDDAKARAERLEEMNRLEGFNPKTLLQMIPHLPPALETPGAVVGKAFRVEIPGKNDGETLGAYSVLLPDGYTPNRAHPVIITLTTAGRPAEKQLEWWGGAADGRQGQSQRHGYVVLAPEWLDAKQRDYDYGVKAHNTVINTLRDALQRFHLDADRVFLSGHGAGGDAAFDIGMSHPDLFAGVVPITGVADKYCKWYWSNAKSVGWYVVTGELDRDSLAKNAREINRMLSHNYDVMYVEFTGRGYESYYEEIHRIFQWMDLHRRAAPPKEIDVNVLRPCDTRFHWLQAHDVPANVLQATVLADGPGNKVTPMNLVGKVTEGNTIYVTSASRTNTVWLSPALVNFDKRVKIHRGGKQKFNEFVQADAGVILEDLRTRGDRQRVNQAQVTID